MALTGTTGTGIRAGADVVKPVDISEAVELFSMLADTLATPPPLLARMVQRHSNQRMYVAIRDEATDALLTAVGAVDGHPVTASIRRRVELVAPSVLAKEDAPGILAWANSEGLLQDAQWWTELAVLPAEYAGELLGG